MRYNSNQEIELEREFCRNKYICYARITELAENLKLSNRHVKVWFQNRRMEHRQKMRKTEPIVCQLHRNFRITHQDRERKLEEQLQKMSVS